jgi:hypothetical protein
MQLQQQWKRQPNDEGDDDDDDDDAKLEEGHPLAYQRACSGCTVWV